MKRLLTFLALFLAALTAGAQQQSPEMVRFLKDFPQRAAFNTHSYEFHPLHDTPAPKGYEAFYISHYGRHGSRSEWGGAAYAHVRDILAKGKQMGILTAKGDSLLRESSFIYDSYNGMDGRLTPRGVREHARLAERMYNRYPAVFKKGSKKIRAVSSTVPRCIVSMNGFTARLSAIQPDLDIDLDTGEKYMEYISKAETETIGRRTREAMAARRGRTASTDTVTVLRNLFTDPVAGKALIPNINYFQYSIYATAKVAEAFDIDDNLFRYLPFDVVYQYHESNFLSAYLNQCNSELNGDLRMPRAKDMADVMIRQADEVIAGKQRAADLCFGHDWPYLGLASYFGLEGIGDRLSVEDAAAHWMASWNCPFAANLQLVFYRSKRSADILVKFLVNERETLIPALQPVQGPYYRWDDVKAFCENRVPKTQIIAHRGWWNVPGASQNSIASLRNAQDGGCAGSEFDLHLTADDVVVVNHDPTVGDFFIQQSASSDILAQRLSNGETVSTLDEYLTQGEKSRDCLLVLELKPHDNQEREDILIDKCIDALKAHGLLRPDRIAFISFSHYICRRLAAEMPGYTVQYLEGDLSPAVLHAEGINGIDYHFSVFDAHPEWVREAHRLGMSVNVWTVDEADDIRRMRDLGVDQITTNDPALTNEILYRRK
ncbi:MAG: histidine-type phosphatase [Bacteroidales bacterium]|nr:histidine-type phosphatase [Bacteroidales bacterium]